MLLKEWAKWQQAQGLAQRTINERADTVRRFLAEMGTTPLTAEPNHIIDFCGRRHLSQSTKATYHTSLRNFFSWLVITDKLDSNPCDKTPSPKRPKSNPRPVTSAHIDRLLTTALRRRTRMMVLLASYAGLRVHEIAKFHGSDYDRVGERLIVRGKGSKIREIPVHLTIAEYANLFPINDYWFPAYASQTTATHIRSESVSQAISKSMSKAGFKATAHQLRHWFATELLHQGVDIRVVQELLGHDQLSTTQIYTQVSHAQLVAAVRTLPIERTVQTLTTTSAINSFERAIA